MSKDLSGASKAAAIIVVAVACLLGLAGLVLEGLPGRPAVTVTVEDRGADQARPSGELAANAPRISDVAATGITEKRATITWQTDEMASGQVDYGQTDAYGKTATAFRYTTSHSVTLKNLNPGTTYHYRVISSGWWFSGTSQSGDFTFTTLGEGGGDQAPVISKVAATAITDSGATITWTTDKDADSQVDYGLTARYGSSTPLLPGLTRSHSVVLSGLAPGTVYHYRARSNDAQGRRAESADRTFTTLGSSALTISGMVVTDVTATGCTVVWTTSVPADSQVVYGPDINYGSQSARTDMLEKDHRVVLAGLSQATVYHCQAVSKDASGAVTRSADYQFVTVDSTPPVISDVVAGSITDSSAVITWTTDSAAEGSVEYGTSDRYGLVSAYDNTMVMAHRVALSGLAAQTVYHYKVKSRDASGQWAESADFTFTTGVDMSIDPPAIMYLTATQVTSSGATICWSTDELATARVDYGESADYGQRFEAGAELSTEHSLVLTGLRSGITYHYRVRSTDAAGNETVSADRTFSTPIERAPVPSLPAWAWAAIGVGGVAAVGILVLKNR